MKSNYKALGEYIRKVELRNTGDKKDNLLGVSVSKVFITSIANTVGTDFTTYKIVKRGQFTYIPDTSRRGDKIGIAMLEHLDEGLVSQAYTVFEISDTNKLLPEYLMMWFRRPEFDRYARFISHGSVREIFEWEDMCNTKLPIPSIEKQKAIVAEYNTIQNRITLNNQLIQKLEETAQTIYKQWFVDFEFPNEEGKPYKSSCGEMVESELGEIPKGWKNTTLSNYSILSQGIQVEVDDQFLEQKDGMNRFLRIIDYTPNTNELPRYVIENDSRYFCSNYEIAMIRYGDAGTVCRRLEGIIANNLFKISPLNGLTNNFLYYFLKDSEIQKKIRNSDLAVAMPAITHSTIKELPIVYPQNAQKLIMDFDNYSQLIENNILLKIKEIENLKSLINLLLSKLATLEN